MLKTTFYFFLLLSEIIYVCIADDDRIYFPDDLTVSTKPLTKSSAPITEGKERQ